MKSSTLVAVIALISALILLCLALNGSFDDSFETKSQWNPTGLTISLFVVIFVCLVIYRPIKNNRI